MNELSGPITCKIALKRSHLKKSTTFFLTISKILAFILDKTDEVIGVNAHNL